MSKSESPSQLIFVSHKSEDILIVRSLIELLKSEMDNITFFCQNKLKKEIFGEKRLKES
jgi:hypothetical protein